LNVKTQSVVYFLKKKREKAHRSRLTEKLCRSSKLMGRVREGGVIEKKREWNELYDNTTLFVYHKEYMINCL